MLAPFQNTWQAASLLVSTTLPSPCERLSLIIDIDIRLRHERVHMWRIHKLLHLDRWHLHLILHLLGHQVVLLRDKGLLLRVGGE